MNDRAPHLFAAGLLAALMSRSCLPAASTADRQTTLDASLTPLPTNFQTRPLPGHPPFVFTIYGVPSEIEALKQVVQVMREQQLGNGFDPGPTPHRNTKPVFDYLAGVGWPVVW